MRKRTWLIVLIPLMTLVGILHAQSWNSNTGRNSSQPTLSGTTSSIGGGALLAGACAAGTVSVTGAVVVSPVIVTASDGTNIPALGVAVSGTVTSAGTVTVDACALVAVTPTAKTYSVRVVQ